MRLLPARQRRRSTSVTPTNSSPWRTPSAANTSLVATGMRGLTSTQGIFGRLSGNSVSPTPVMSQARDCTDTPARRRRSRRDSSSALVVQRETVQLAPAGAARPRHRPIRRRCPAATGSTLSSVKLPSRQIATRAFRQLRGLQHQIVGGVAAGRAPAVPTVVSFKFSAGRQRQAIGAIGERHARFRGRDSRRRAARPPAGSG